MAARGLVVSAAAVVPAEPSIYCLTAELLASAAILIAQVVAVVVVVQEVLEVQAELVAMPAI